MGRAQIHGLAPVFDQAPQQTGFDRVGVEAVKPILVLGDPGPWICAGMTGGVLYLRLQPHLNFDQAAIQRRLARGAKVMIQEVGERDLKNLQELLTIYAEELKHNHQNEESQKILSLLVDWVEKNLAPSMSVTVTAGSRSLPMCSYPMYPRYMSGPVDAASSYACTAP
jgi:hypothetical protein